MKAALMKKKYLKKKVQKSPSITTPVKKMIAIELMIMMILRVGKTIPSVAQTMLTTMMM